MGRIEVYPQAATSDEFLCFYFLALSARRTTSAFELQACGEEALCQQVLRDLPSCHIRFVLTLSSHDFDNEPHYTGWKHQDGREEGWLNSRYMHLFAVDYTSPISERVPFLMFLPGLVCLHMIFG